MPGPSDAHNALWIFSLVCGDRADDDKGTKLRLVDAVVCGLLAGEVAIEDRL